MSLITITFTQCLTLRSQDRPCRIDEIHHGTSNFVWFSSGGRALKNTIYLPLIYFGQNPLHFSFPPEIDADALMSGAEQLSQAVLESGIVARFPSTSDSAEWGVRGADSEIVRAHHDMQAQMINRKERLQFLIRFINENGVLTKVMDMTSD